MKTRNLKPKIQIVSAFTLIELLVVIAIIAILAAFLIPVAGVVGRTQKISRARAEMARLETAIDSYKSMRGYYPPDNPNDPMTNQLYYELTGTTLIPGATPAANPSYQTFDTLQTLTGGSPGSELAMAFNGR